MDAVGPGEARLSVEFQRRRDRWAFLQPLLGYPQLVVLAIVSVPLTVTLVLDWFSLVITGRQMSVHHGWCSVWIAATIRVWAYLNLIVGVYPGWRLHDEARSLVRLEIGSPKPAYSRLRAVGRIVYMLPAWAAAVLGGMIGYALAIVSAIQILITGTQTRGIFDAQCWCLAQFACYGLLANLITEDYTLPIVDHG